MRSQIKMEKQTTVINKFINKSQEKNQGIRITDIMIVMKGLMEINFWGIMKY